jgi:hypothetical protein
MFTTLLYGCCAACVLGLVLFRYLQLRYASRTYREYQFVEVHVREVDAAVRLQFETYTPALVDYGFQWLGDYRMKPRPVEVYDRLFISDDGEMLADICSVLAGGGVSLISVLEDGTCLETTTTEDPDPDWTFERSDGLWVTHVPGASIPYLHSRHLDAVRQVSARNGTRLLRLSRDRFREVVVYSQRAFCRWVYRHGGMDQEPPPPDFSSLGAVAAPGAEKEGPAPSPSSQITRHDSPAK